MIEAKFKKRVTWPWPRPLGKVCHRKPNTWYILPAYKIWRLSLQPFRRYDCRHRNEKWSHDPNHPPPYQGWFVILKLRYVMIYPCTKFNDSSFSRSRDIIGGTKKFTRVSAAADRPARRSGSAHAKYSVLHHGNQTISYARPSCLIQISTAGVTNSCPTTIREFMTLSWN